VGFKYEKIYQNNTKEELETLKKSEVATSDDKTSNNTAPKTQVHVTSTPAKASKQRSRLRPIHQKDQPKPPFNLRGAPKPVFW